jgi:hypothetical protein
VACLTGGWVACPLTGSRRERQGDGAASHQRLV